MRSLVKLLDERGTDAFLVLSSANISYVTHSRSRDSYLLITPKASFYLTDSRYLEEARLSLPGYTIVALDASGMEQEVRKLCASLNIKSCAFEQQYISYGRYLRLKKTLGRATRLEPVSGLVEGLRSVKDRQEIETMRRAVAITKKAFNFINKFIIPGVRELEIAAELERFVRLNGASGSSFDIIVASGPNSSLPHHLTSERKVRASEPVIVDIGVDVNGYKSDLTRVFFSGKINSLCRAAYDTVRAAQEKAIEAVRPGIPACDIDSAARSYIKERYAGECFGHSLGHGVGLEVHEEPRISPGSKVRLRPGMVFTVEPAVYVQGKFGIRLEEMVLVTTRGREVF